MSYTHKEIYLHDDTPQQIYVLDCYFIKNFMVISMFVVSLLYSFIFPLNTNIRDKLIILYYKDAKSHVVNT